MEDDEASTLPADMRGPRLTYEQMQRRRRQQQENLSEAKEEAKAAGEKIAAIDPHGKLISEAATENLGGQVRYIIEDRISLPRQKSAMLPLMDKQIESTRVCIFNESVHTKFPVMGLRVRNTSGRLLTQGPITVYEDGTYAGDAQLPELQPNEERLISYAIDQATEVKTETRVSHGPSMIVSRIGDSLNIRHAVRETRKYKTRNRSAIDRLMVIEHPIRKTWELAQGVKPSERSRDLYRFDVPVAAGKDVEFEVAEEQQRSDFFASKQHSRNDGVQAEFFPTELDLRAEIATVQSAPTVANVRIVKGMLSITNMASAKIAYRLTNTSKNDDRDATIRHIDDGDWRAINADDPKSPPQTQFRIKLAAGASKSVDVQSRREQIVTLSATLIPLDDLEKLAANTKASEKVRDALKKVLNDRTAMNEDRSQMAERERRLKEIADDQDRLRKNIANLPPTSAAHKRYLEKFDAQETEIEKLQQELKKIKEGAAQKLKDLTALLTNLNAE